MLKLSAMETTTAVAQINYDDFAKVQLRVATILEAAPIEKSKKLQGMHATEH